MTAGMCGLALVFDYISWGRGLPLKKIPRFTRAVRAEALWISWHGNFVEM